MTGSRYITPYAYAYQTTGEPIPGALLEFFLTTSSTHTDTYKTSDLDGERNENPVQADDSGTFPAIFLDPAIVYKVILSYPVWMGNQQVWMADPVYVTRDNGTAISGGGGGGGTVVDIPTGAIMPFAMSLTPTGWLACDGAQVSRVDYADLFTAIGVLYGGGNGVNTFNVPDLRGQFVRGWDAGRGVDAGRTLGSWEAGSFASHTHTASVSGTPSITDPGHTHLMFAAGYAPDHPDYITAASSVAFGTTDEPGETEYKMRPYPATPSTGLTGSQTTGVTLDASALAVANAAAGGGENRPVNIALAYCIKT